MIAINDDQRAVQEIGPIRMVLPLAPSTYHAHATRRAVRSRAPAPVRSDALLMLEIRCVFRANSCGYGVRKVRQQLARGRF